MATVNIESCLKSVAIATGQQLLLNIGTELLAAGINSIFPLINQYQAQENNTQESRYETPVTEPEKEEKAGEKEILTDKQKLEKINTLLLGTQISLESKNEEFIKNVIKKYDNMIEYYTNNGGIDTNESTIKLRLANYIKGLEFREQENSWAEALLDDNLENTQAKTMPTTKAAYLELAEQYIETGNVEGDVSGANGLSFEEFVKMECGNQTEITTDDYYRLQEYFDKLNQKTIDTNGDGIADKNDAVLDKTELATHFATMAVINDKGNNGTFNNITANEWATTQFALSESDWFTRLSNASVIKLKEWLDNNPNKIPNENDLKAAGLTDSAIGVIFENLFSNYSGSESDDKIKNNYLSWKFDVLRNIKSQSLNVLINSEKLDETILDKVDPSDRETIQNYIKYFKYNNMSTSYYNAFKG